MKYNNDIEIGNTASNNGKLWIDSTDSTNPILKVNLDNGWIQVNSKINNKEIINNDNSITYKELKHLCDTGKLVVNTKYRIIDYICTTTQKNTRAVNNQYDIIVTAITPYILSREAYACENINNTYYKEIGVQLSTWKLLYNIENDISEYSWADPINGKGVVYNLIDENKNSCPYDFKCIQFLRDTSIDKYKNITALAAKDNYYYTFNIIKNNTCYDSSVYYKILNTVLSINVCLNKVCFTTDTTDNRLVLNNTIFNINVDKNTPQYRCSQNIIAYGNINNTFTNNCINNTIQTQFKDNIILNYLYDCTIGDNVNNLYVNTNTLNIKIDNNCSYFIIDKTNVNFNNVNIKQGVTGTATIPLKLSIEPNNTINKIIDNKSDGTLVCYCEADIYKV